MSLQSASDTVSETSSIMSQMTRYTLALNPEDWEDEWQSVIDGGEVDEESLNSCPQCKQVFKSRKENYGSWIAGHIRLHNVQGRRRLLCSEQDLMDAADDLARSALHKISEESSFLGLWVAVDILAKSRAECSNFFSFSVSRVAQCVCQTNPVFLNDERKTVLKGFHQLAISINFRKYCLTEMSALNSPSQHPNRYLTTYLSMLRDVCCLYRMSRMRARTVEPPLAKPANRDKIVLYCAGWVMRSFRRNYWLRGGMKHKLKEDRFNCLMEYFVENGKYAQQITDPVKRSWIDRRDRGQVQKDGEKSRLMDPKACIFFEGLDAIIFNYEYCSSLREKMTFEAIVAQVYDSLTVLDSWQALTSSLDNEAHQTAFLEFVVQHYRRFLGHAIGKRVIRCLNKRKKVAIRTHLKANH